MREEFVSNSFLAVTVVGLVLLCSGLIAFALTRSVHCRTEPNPPGCELAGP